jgi:hypothetical protein
MVGRFYGAQGHVPHVINAGLRPVTFRDLLAIRLSTYLIN